jgi:hypothetical protein
VNENPTCQHPQVDNDSWECLNPDCRERMIGQTVEPETVLSADNLAACSNPACLEALKSGTYDESNPPPGCTNPHGTYIPDTRNQRTIVLGWRFTYSCVRCESNAHEITWTSRELPIWPCGGVHCGEYVAARSRESS